MENKTKKTKFRVALCVLITAIVLIIIALLFFWLMPLKKASKPTFTYFYEGVCGSCNEGETINRLIARDTSDLMLKQDYELKVVNTFTDSSTKWEQACDTLAIPEKDRLLPMLVSDTDYIVGDVAINEGFRAFFCREMQILDEKSLYYYFRPDCKDCIATEPFATELLEKYPDYSIIRTDTTPPLSKEAFKSLLAEKGISQEEWQVPFVILGDDYLSGSNAIETGLKSLLDKHNN